MDSDKNINYRFNSHFSCSILDIFYSQFLYSIRFLITVKLIFINFWPFLSVLGFIKDTRKESS